MDANECAIALCRAAEVAGYLLGAGTVYAWLTGRIGGYR